MSKKLLVIEDSKPIARIIETIAQSLNFDVTLATSLESVKKIVEEDNSFFVATVDYGLPDAENGEAIPYVISKGIPSIVLTGMMDDETRQEILSQPVIDYIPKENSQAFLYLKRILEYQLTNSIYGILVVDDSLSTRNYIVELLKRRNFTVYTATQGKEALEVLAENSDIKLVITDLEMPVMDGITLCNEIRKKYSREQLAIIGISGAINGTHSARFIKNGADDFLRKPFCLEEFYCRITQNIDNLNNIEKIQHAANTDYLTELPNRRAFFTNAEPCVQQYIKDKATYCVAIFDIDFFKKVNDVHGHDAGDHILKVFALYLRKHLGTGLLSRLGGEEFSVVLSGTDKKELYTKLDQFRENVASSAVSYADTEINYSVSIGVVFNSTKTLTQQMIEADAALYFAKENGRNRIAVADKI
ncbi:diguanylate cyclase [Pseudocolwellia sp. HL-MZ7]|uniref:diguanylate cyclase n=1 Tax=Pseudocolwellia sp. HL-MZ7 TaxID=3400627 RepID=UPI003CEE5D3F